MDTYKDKQRFDDMYSHGETPWEVWEQNGKISKHRAGKNGNGVAHVRPAAKPR
jgi:hypothetical protein